MSDVKIVKIMKSDMLSFWHNLRTGIKRHLNINEILTDDARGFVVALTLGDKSLMPLSLMQLFSNTGTMHLFAVSGLHVGICCVFFKSIFMWLLPRPRLHISLSLLATFFYVLLVGYSASSCRAFIMICFLYGSALFCRKRNGFSSNQPIIYTLKHYTCFYNCTHFYFYSFLPYTGHFYPYGLHGRMHKHYHTLHEVNHFIFWQYSDCSYWISRLLWHTQRLSSPFSFIYHFIQTFSAKPTLPTYFFVLLSAFFTSFELRQLMEKKTPAFRLPRLVYKPRS